MQSVEERVQAGALFLDNRVPGWSQGIKLKRLDLQNGAQCVLGQLFGDFVAAHRRFGFGSVQAAELGFNAVTRAEFPELDQAWRKLVAERQGAASERRLVGQGQTSEGR